MKKRSILMVTLVVGIVFLAVASRRTHHPASAALSLYADSHSKKGDRSAELIEKVETLNRELDEVMGHVTAAEGELEATQLLVSNQNQVLREIEDIEADNDAGKLTPRDYLERRAQMSARVLSAQ